MVFPGRYESLAEIADFVRAAARETGLDDFSIYAVETAVDEACSNIIEHAYQGEDNGVIECALTIKPDRLTIVLEDQGLPFNPKDIPDPKLSVPLEERDDHGLGLFFIRQMMDEVFFENTGPERGNRVTMIKYKEHLGKKHRHLRGHGNRVTMTKDKEKKVG